MSDQALLDEALGEDGESLAGAEAAADEASMTLVSESDGAEASEAAPWGPESEPLAASEETKVEVMPSAKPATMLTGLSVQPVDGGALVGLAADGTLDNIEVFTLEKPMRLVIDVQGVKVGPTAKNVKLDSPFVTAARLGAHEGKVRIVIDGGSQSGDFANRQLMPGATGMFVAIGDGEPLAQSMTTALDATAAAFLASAATAVEPMATAAPASPDAMASSMEEPASETALSAAPESIPAEVPAQPSSAAVSASSEIYGLSFERLDSMDRTAILANQAIQYTTYSPDPGTLVVRIANASISAEASDRLFPEQGGPVSMIHAFQQPDVDVPEVRVVFTRAPDQKPVFSTHGSTLFVDFEDMGVAAASPPAFPGASPASDPAAPQALASAGEPAAESAAASLPSVEELEATSNQVSPAAMEAAEALFAEPAPAQASAAPAAVEVPAAIEVLEEGGLIDGKEYRGRRVSLDFKDVAIADVLRLIAEVSDLNIIAGDEVSGNVTIRLVEVPWDQALDVILMTKGLGFVRVGNVLRIAPADVLKAEEEVRLQERRNKEKLEDLEVKLLPVNYAAVKDIEGLVRRLLSSRGTVNLDKRTNTLIIKDISSVIDEASALIAAIDTQTPQVMIEAKIVEANLDFSRELGSVWGIQTQQFVDPFDPDTLRTDLGSEDYRFIDDNSLAFANPITAVPTGLLSLGALILDEDFRVDAQIQAAESTGDGKVISSPRIVTLDNKEATIQQGVSIPFQTFEGGDARLEFIDAVLSLVVTPHITADQSIIMAIVVTRNAPDSTVPTPTGSPAISKNVAQTETLVKDGQTLVLGGIYTITKSQRQTRVPYLHRIPVIGNMFKNNELTDQRKELLVFVTPRIVRLPEMAAN
jgi:type IV pilus secretin PilQ/predicted competence protein